MPLNDTKIRNLKPSSKPVKVSDSHGLHLLINPSGSRLWYLKYRVNGKESRLSFGAYPHVSLADARKQRDDGLAPSPFICFIASPACWMVADW